jgi:hypothetical protein
MTSDAEVADKIADAIRDTRMVIDPQNQVTLYCEYKGGIAPGKTYLFHFIIPLAHFRALFEHAESVPQTPPLPPPPGA